MPRYNVFEHPKYGQRIEPSTGFTALGFFFSVIWLPAKRLWAVGAAFFALLLLTSFAVSALDRAVDERWKLITSAPFEKLNEVPTYQQIWWQYADSHKGLTDNQYHEVARTLYAEEKVRTLELAAVLAWLPSLLFQVLVGLKGREWVTSSLKRRGFELKETVEAPTKDAVLAHLLRKTPT